MYLHFNEIFARIIYSFISIVIYIIIIQNYFEELIFIFVKPFLINLTYFIFTNITESLILYFYFPIIFAIFILVGNFLFHLYYFISPGLYKFEKDNLFILILVSFINWFFCWHLNFKYILPLLNTWFFSFQNNYLILEFHNELKIVSLVFLSLWFLFFIWIILEFFLLISFILIYTKSFLFLILKYRRICYSIFLILISCFFAIDFVTLFFLFFIFFIIFECLIFLILINVYILYH